MKASICRTYTLTLAAISLAIINAGADAHDRVNGISGAITTPANGSTITVVNPADPIQLVGTFGAAGQGAGCGHSTTITASATSGDITVNSSTCNNSIWTWNATWTNYQPGPQTVDASFSQTHGTFMHTGNATATYTLVFPSTCTVGWIAPLDKGKHVVQGNNTDLPIKFCSAGNASSYGGSVCPADQTDGCFSFVADRTDEGIYLYHLDTKAMLNGSYEVNADPSTGIADSATFAIKRQ